MAIAELQTFQNLDPEPINGSSPLPMDREAFCELEAGPFKVKAFSRLIPGSRSLVVFLPAALPGDPAKRHYPTLSRWTWGRKIPVSSIALDDPTLYSGDLAGGWFQGTKDYFAIDSVAVSLLNLCKRLCIPSSNVILYGSSLGGFAGLMIAPRIPGCLTFAEIPQTDLSTYIARGHIVKLCNIVYGTADVAKVRAEYPDRFSVIERYRSLEAIPRFKLIHEITGEPNGATQVYPFVSQVVALASDLKHGLEHVSFEVRNDGKGHAAVTFRETGPSILAELESHA